MAFTYLVNYNFAKLLSIDDKTQEQLDGAIREKFIHVVPACSSIRIQVYLEDFKNYVDVDDYSTLPDKDNLRLFIGGRRDYPTGETTITETTPTSGESTTSSQSTVVTESANTSMETHAGFVDRYQPFPIVYSLPVFPPRVQSQLQSDPAFIVTAQGSSYQRFIISALFTQCERYENKYLKGYQYDVICKMLVTQYPALADKVVPGSTCNLSSHETWKSKLISKFKSERQKLINDDGIQEMRSKFGHTKGVKRSQPSSTSTPSDVDTDVASTSSASTAGSPSVCERKKLRPIVRLSFIGETVDTVLQHISAIDREWAHETPNESVIDERMDRTAEDRLRLYATSVDAVSEKYLLLMNYKQLIKDCERIFQRKLTSTREESLNRTRTEHLLQQTLRNLPLRETRIADMRSERGVQQAAIMANLPLLFKERKDMWISVKELPSNAIGIVARVPEGKSSVDDVADCALFLDGKRVCGDCPGLLSAVDAFVATLFSFGVQYPKRFHNTCRFLCDVVYGFPCETKLPVSVQKLLNTIPTDSCECGGEDYDCPCTKSGV